MHAQLGVQYTLRTLHLLFCLDGLVFSHVIGWDVALPHRRQTPRLPPVTVLVVEDLQVLSLSEAQVLAGPLVVVKEGDEDGSLGNVSVWWQNWWL